LPPPNVVSAPKAKNGGIGVPLTKNDTVKAVVKCEGAAKPAVKDEGADPKKDYSHTFTQLTEKIAYIELLSSDDESDGEDY
jgi:hypothetical protein